MPTSLLAMVVSMKTSALPPCTASSTQNITALQNTPKRVVLADAATMLANGSTQAEAVAFLNEWLTTDVATVPVGASCN